MSRVIAALRLFGIDLHHLARALMNLPRFASDVRRFQRSNRDPEWRIHFSDLRPRVTESGGAGGSTRGHYFQQDLWAARKIHNRKPTLHVDVGSRLDGFVAHVLTFMPVVLLEIRPVDDTVDGLTVVHADATRHVLRAESVESLSSLHAVEHFGLGRYGDPIDPHASHRAMSVLSAALKPGGSLYLGVPIGRQRVEFNEQRVFAPQAILDIFAPLKLVDFAVVDERGRLLQGRDPNEFAGADYVCGLFEFTKRG